MFGRVASVNGVFGSIGDVADSLVSLRREALDELDDATFDVVATSVAALRREVDAAWLRVCASADRWQVHRRHGERDACDVARGRERRAAGCGWRATSNCCCAAQAPSVAGAATEHGLSKARRLRSWLGVASLPGDVVNELARDAGRAVRRAGRSRCPAGTACSTVPSRLSSRRARSCGPVIVCGSPPPSESSRARCSRRPRRLRRSRQAAEGPAVRPTAGGRTRRPGAALPRPCGRRARHAGGSAAPASSSTSRCSRREPAVRPALPQGPSSPVRRLAGRCQCHPHSHAGRSQVLDVGHDARCRITWPTKAVIARYGTARTPGARLRPGLARSIT